MLKKWYVAHATFLSMGSFTHIYSTGHFIAKAILHGIGNFCSTGCATKSYMSYKKFFSILHTL